MPLSAACMELVAEALVTLGPARIPKRYRCVLDETGVLRVLKGDKEKLVR